MVKRARNQNQSKHTLQAYFRDVSDFLNYCENQKLELNNIIEISAKDSLGIDEMENKIYDFIFEESISDSSEKLVITNVRHKTALEKTKDAINNIFTTIDTEMPMDLISVDLREALDALSEITGEISSEDVLDHVFGNFCVGK